MRVSVRLFAAAAEALGTRRLDLELPDGVTAAQCLEELAARGGGRLLARCSIAVERAVVAPDTVLPPGAEIAVLPPVSGGQGEYVVGPEPIAASQLLAAVAAADCGANVLFLGTVRGQTGDVRTAHLEYEAYRDMAVEVLRQIGRAAEGMWPGVRLAMVHRTGVVPPGEAAVAVAAAASHRGDAFAAARFCIERIKVELPVWKKEQAPDGSARWVDHA